MTDHRFFRPDLMELAAAYEQYSVMVTTAQVDLPGPQILYVNSAFSRMTGYSVAELLGRTPRILQGPKTDRGTLLRLRDELSAGHDFIARTVNYKRDRSEFEIEWIISHIRDASGRTTHYVALQRDITGLERARHDLEQFDDELRAASDRLARAVDRLAIAEQSMIQRERLAAIGQMAAGVVHDLRNALGPVAGYVEILGELGGLPPTASEALEGIGASARHGLDLLDNLERFRVGKPGPMADVDLRAVVQQIPYIIRPLLDEHLTRHQGRVQIALELAAVPPVRGNAVELTQALVNLVSNAVEAISGEGVVTIGLRPGPRAIVLTVQDTGPGIPAQMLGRCFEPYATTKPGNSGLGLSVCHGVVERHHGEISVRNGSPSGAVFTIVLPTAADADSAVAPDQSPSTRQRLLYIDDDEGCRALMSRWLDRSGFEVTTAASGDAGLELAHAREYAAVLTDTRMTPTSGVDVAAVLQRTRPMQIVILVSGAGLTDGELPDSLKGCPRLLKPFTPSDVVSAIALAARS